MTAKGSSGGLRGSKLSAYEGGIRVPAVIYWKGVLEKSKSEQFFFAQDILPTMLAASSIRQMTETLPVLIDGTVY